MKLTSFRRFVIIAAAIAVMLRVLDPVLGVSRSGWYVDSAATLLQVFGILVFAAAIFVVFPSLPSFRMPRITDRLLSAGWIAYLFIAGVTFMTRVPRIEVLPIREGWRLVAPPCPPDAPAGCYVVTTTIGSNVITTTINWPLTILGVAFLFLLLWLTWTWSRSGPHNFR